MEEIKKYIEEAQTICLAAHVFPDGDAIGSMGAMYHFLKEIGKKVYMIQSTTPKKFSFLPAMDMVTNELQVDEYDLLIYLDVSSDDRLDISKEDILKAKKKVVIDHHRNNTISCDAKLVDEASPANCEIIYNLIKYMNHSISSNIANYIYVGLLTDTGSFNYERTTSTTYKIAGEMIECGADFANICKRINDTFSETKMKLLADMITNMESYYDGKLRIGVVDRKMIDKFSATEEDLEGYVNYLRCIEGTIVSIFMRAIDDTTYKVSVRSEEPIDASNISEIFGGGGHKRAAGFFTDDLEGSKIKLIKMLERLLKSENNRNT